MMPWEGAAIQLCFSELLLATLRLHPGAWLFVRAAPCSAACKHKMKLHSLKSPFHAFK